MEATALIYTGAMAYGSARSLPTSDFQSFEALPSGGFSVQKIQSQTESTQTHGFGSIDSCMHGHGPTTKIFVLVAAIRTCVAIDGGLAGKQRDHEVARIVRLFMHEDNYVRH